MKHNQSTVPRLTKYYAPDAVKHSGGNGYGSLHLGYLTSLVLASASEVVPI